MPENHDHSKYVAVESHYEGHRRDINDLDLKAYIDERIANAIGSSSYLVKTYAELVSLIASDGLIAGTLYKISDRGGRGLFFQAISTTQLAENGTRLMLCPSTYALVTDGSGNIWKGVWNYNKSFSIGDLAIWGGLVWRNLDGQTGNELGDILLDSSWQVITKESFSNNEYTEKVFGVCYDIANDWISKQWDNSSNVFGIDYSMENGFFNLGFNPVDICDWNFATSGHDFYGNQNIGTWNNSNAGYIVLNRTAEQIRNNYGTGHISYNLTESNIEWNSCGVISDNIIVNGIYQNSNTGDIRGNRCYLDIHDNSNGGNINQNSCGEIGNNSNTGNINNNNIKGSITTIGAANANIINNTNNGNISTTTTGDISDPTVNK